MVIARRLVVTAVLLALAACSGPTASAPPVTASTPTTAAIAPATSAPATGGPATGGPATTAGQATAGPATSAGDLRPFVDDWIRHSTAFTIRADGTGEVHERTYTPCGTSQDCAFNANLTVEATAARSATVTFSRVWFIDATGNGERERLTAADHRALDPYFPLQGDRMKAVVDRFGRLVLSPIGATAQRLTRGADAETYCGKATKPGHTTECGA